MNYPELDLEAALNGAPVIMLIEPHNEQVGHLYKSHQAKDTWIFENTKGECWPEIEHLLIEKTRMYVKPVVFEYWDLLSEQYFELAKSGEGTFYARSTVFGKVDILHERQFKKGFFPDCPVGTVIHRPQKKVGEKEC